MRNNIELLQSGLKCDNPSCDWKDTTIPHTEYINHVNKPCPKCGENILTGEDYETAMYFHTVVDFINNMENIEKLKVTVDLHKGITFNIEEDGE